MPPSASRAPRSPSRMVGTPSLRARVNTARRPSIQRRSPSTASASLTRSSGSQLGPPGGAPPRAPIPLPHDQPLALVVDDNGGGPRARALERLDVTHVDAFRLQ